MEWGGIFVLKLRGNNAQNGGKKGRKLTAMALYTFVLLFLNLNEEEDHVAASNGLAQLSPLNFFLYLCLFLFVLFDFSFNSFSLRIGSKSYQTISEKHS